MDERRCAVSGLHEIWLKGIHQKGGDGALDSHVADKERLIVIVESEKDVPYFLLQVVDACGKAKYSHNLRGRSNVKACLSRNAICQRTETGNNLTKTPVVDILYPLPQYLFQTETIGGMLIQIVIEKRGNHVVG